MVTPFDALDAALSVSCLSAFGEAAELRPRKASQYSERAADPSRPAAPIRGIYSAGPNETPIRGEVTGSEFKGPTRFVTMQAEFWVAAEDVAQLPYKIAKGDLVLLTARGGTPYEVVAAQPTDMGDVNLILSYDGVTPVSAPPAPGGDAP